MLLKEIELEIQVIEKVYDDFMFQGNVYEVYLNNSFLKFFPDRCREDKRDFVDNLQLALKLALGIEPKVVEWKD